MRVLSLDGGGYLGLASATFLHTLEQRHKTTCAERFDLFCGTSTGAIIALALASGFTAERVVSLYEDLGPKVFLPPTWFEKRWPKLRIARAVFRPLHDNRALRECLEAAFGNATLDDLEQTRKRVLITAFNVSTGRPVIFKTDHSAELRAHGRYRLVDIALASCAAPMFFPLVELKDPLSGVSQRFCDGGVVTNSPALLGYVEAVRFFRQPPETVAILSVGTPRLDLAEVPSDLNGKQRSLSRGLLGWDLGGRIITLAVDAGAMAADTSVAFLAEISRTRYTRVHLPQPPGLGLDVVTPAATHTLKQLGAAKAAQGDVQRQTVHFFTDREV